MNETRPAPPTPTFDEWLVMVFDHPELPTPSCLTAGTSTTTRLRRPGMATPIPSRRWLIRRGYSRSLKS